MKALLFLAVLAASVSAAGAETRIKDITSVEGVRDNQLIGYGLVIGLQGTGDSVRNSPFTERIGMKAAAYAMGASNHLAAAQTLVRIGEPFQNLVMSAWTDSRDLPPAPRQTFRQWWASRG